EAVASVPGGTLGASSATAGGPPSTLATTSVAAAVTAAENRARVTVGVVVMPTSPGDLDDTSREHGQLERQLGRLCGGRRELHEDGQGLTRLQIRKVGSGQRPSIRVPQHRSEERRVGKASSSRSSAEQC